MPEKKTTITTTIRIPAEIKRNLDQLAQEDGRSFNNLVSLILTKYVKNEKK